MRSLVAILTLFLLAAGVRAEQKDVERLKAEAMKASGGQQGKLYAEVAESLVEVANEQFGQGDSAKGHATVQELLDYAMKAHDAALNAKSNRKEVEIHLRTAQRHLENVKRTLAAEDRPALEAAAKKLSDMRQELLDAMFAPPKKDSK
jgi:predicted DNA binding CopG/RHH family protein